MKRLVIVESPTKAKTIRNFLPKDYVVAASMGHIRDLPESASEIPAAYKAKDWARLGVDVANDFTPLYVVSSRKRKTVQELKELLKSADELIIATDEDREGESIGWHLLEVLKPKIPVRRMVFHEITQAAIQEALKNYRQVDTKLVRAQETRRILDRLVGYTISPLLWKKIAPGLSAGRVQSVAVRLLVQREEARRAFKSGTYWDLKATLITEKAPKQPFEALLQSVNGVKVASGKDFDETTGKIPPKKKVLLLDERAATVLAKRLATGAWQVMDLAERQQSRTPPPPFTTSTLQQEANRKLRLSAKQTMQIAQKLYEEGYITYMRTDSVNLSKEAISAARKAISARFGDNYLSAKPRQYTTKSKGAQEAHEAIRPAGTQMRTADEIGLFGQEAALYTLIWMRTIASQMAEAQITTLTVNIRADSQPASASEKFVTTTFQANGRRIDFPGFLRAYVEGSDDPEAALEDQETILPPMAKDDPLTARKVEPLKHETQPPARYTEASLVQTLEKEGIGRPSTYASIISTIIDRGYVVKAGNNLVPTFTAYCVNRLLESNFPDLVDTKFTARMEQTLDEIAEGEVEWLPYLNQFYNGDHGLEKQVEAKLQSIDPREMYALALEEVGAKIRIGRYGAYIEQSNGDADEPKRASLPETLPPAELTPEAALNLLKQKTEGPNILGTHPHTGEPIYVLQGPYGWYVQQGDTPEKSEPAAKGRKKTAAKTAKSVAPKPKRASLLPGMKPETLTLADALKLLSLPRELGPHPQTGETIIANVGRFGPFIKHGNEFRSLKDSDDVLTISMERALELLSQPKPGRRRGGVLRELGAHPKDSTPVQVMDGRYGAFLKHGEVLAPLPKNADLSALTLAEAVNILAEKGKVSPKKPARKSAAAKGAGASTQHNKSKPTKRPSSTRKKPAKAQPPTLGKRSR